MRAKTELQIKARELYLTGKSYNQIRDQLKVSKSSLSLWLCDLAKERRNAIVAAPIKPILKKPPSTCIPAQAPYEEYNLVLKKPKGHPGVVKLTHRESGEVITISLLTYTMEVHLGRRVEPNEHVRRKRGAGMEITNLKVINFSQGLTEESVIRVRRLAHENPRLDITELCRAYKVCDATMRAAIKGHSYTQLNEVHPPYRGWLARRVQITTKREKTRNIVREALTLHRSDPNSWTYDRIIEWLALKTGKSYKVGHVTMAFQGVDSSFTPHTNGVSGKVKQKKVSRECVICESIFETIREDAEVCFSKQCRKTLKEYSLS